MNCCKNRFWIVNRDVRDWRWQKRNLRQQLEGRGLKSMIYELFSDSNVDCFRWEFTITIKLCGGGFSLGSSWSDSLAQHLVFQYSIYKCIKNQICCMYFCVTCSIICSIIIRDWRLLLFYFMWGRVCYCLRNGCCVLS